MFLEAFLAKIQFWPVIWHQRRKGASGDNHVGQKLGVVYGWFFTFPAFITYERYDYHFLAPLRTLDFLPYFADGLGLAVFFLLGSGFLGEQGILGLLAEIFPGLKLCYKFGVLVF
jgi:hypothetical protein